MWRATTVLMLAGLSTPHKDYGTAGLTRGKAIHDAAEALAEGYTPAVEKDYEGYSAGLVIWFQKFSPTIVSIERRIVSRLKKLTGRIDLICIIDGRVWIIDIKTGGKVWWHALQTALYALLACEDEELWGRIMDAADMSEVDAVMRCRTPHEIGRAALYLPGTGRCDWQPFTDPQDIYIARSALALLTLRHEHGLVEYTDPEHPDDDLPAVHIDTTAF